MKVKGIQYRVMCMEGSTLPCFMEILCVEQDAVRFPLGGDGTDKLQLCQTMALMRSGSQYLHNSIVQECEQCVPSMVKSCDLCWKLEGIIVQHRVKSRRDSES